MDENLLGYLLDALDPDDHRQVEAYLRTSPEGRRRLDTLRRLLQPLAADRDGDEPPAGLADRTVAVCLREAPATLQFTPTLPQAPKLRLGQKLGPSMAWLRRGDALVAASILFVFIGVAIPVLNRVVHQQQVLACQKNLHEFHTSLVSYSANHSNEFPRVEANPPRNRAGFFVPLLKDAGLLNAVSVACPGNGKPQPPPDRTVAELEALHRKSPEEYGDAVRDLSCCYAYSLGYRSGGAHHGLRRGIDGDRTPILADRPAYLGNNVRPGNSPNHGGGQNVLYVDGHVEFRTTRGAGPGGDDIYVNRDRKVGAGHDRDDAVLGASWTCP